MSMFDSFILNHHSNIIEQQTKNFDNILSCERIGDKTNLSQIDKLPFDQDNIRIISIQKGYSQEPSHYYNIVFLSNIMADYSLCSKESQQDNKKHLIDIWSNPDLIRIGLTRLIHIRKQIENPVLFIKEDNKKHIHKKYLDNRITTSKIFKNFIFKQENNSSDKTSQKKLIKFLGSVDRGNAQFTGQDTEIANIRLTGYFFDELKKMKSIDVLKITTKELENDFVLNSFGHELDNVDKLKLIMPSFILNSEKAKLIHLLSPEELNFKTHGQSLDEYLISTQGINSYLTKILLEKLNYKNINAWTKINTLYLNTTKDELYNKINHDNLLYNNEPVIFKLLEQEDINIYQLIYLLDTKYSIWDINKKGQSVFSIFRKKYFNSLQEGEADLIEQIILKLSKSYDISILMKPFQQRINCILIMNFIKKEIIETEKPLNTKQLKEIHQWTYFIEKKYNIQTNQIDSSTKQNKEKLFVYTNLKKLSDNIELKKIYDNDTIKTKKNKVL